MARKTIKMGRSTRLKPSSFGSDFPSVETEEGSGRALAKKPPSVKTGEPSGGPLAKRGSTEVARPGRPSIDVDGQKRLSGFKDVSGPAERVSKPALSAPEKPSLSKASTKGAGLASRLLGGAALAAYSPDVGKGSDKPRNYPGEGLSPVGPPRQTKAASATPSAPVSKPSASVSKPSAPAPKASAPAPKPKAKPTSSKAKSSAEYDDWLADLRGSAARMKAETSRAAEKTGAMKEKASAFSQSFKKGGSVKSRGDGIAQRGRTKGRFV